MRVARAADRMFRPPSPNVPQRSPGAGRFPFRSDQRAESRESASATDASFSRSIQKRYGSITSIRHSSRNPTARVRRPQPRRRLDRHAFEEAGSADAFGAAVATVLRDSQKRRRMSEAARAHALSLRWETALTPLYRAYADVAASGKRPRAARSRVAHTPGSAVA
jgi:hypothetical protein